jgi:hypothetical protein
MWLTFPILSSPVPDLFLCFFFPLLFKIGYFMSFYFFFPPLPVLLGDMGSGSTPDRSTANLGIVGELIGMLLCVAMQNAVAD